VNKFIDHSQVVTTNNCNRIADFNTTNHSTLSLLGVFPLVAALHSVFARCFLARNFTNGDSSASVARWLTLHSWTLNSILLPALELDSLITTFHGPHGKHSLYCRKSLFTALLPSNRCSIVPRVYFCGYVFNDLLPSSGHGADHIENTTYSTIFACPYFGCCLDLDLHVTI
jgi:hypothetical protein